MGFGFRGRVWGLRGVGLGFRGLWALSLEVYGFLRGVGLRGSGV